MEYQERLDKIISIIRKHPDWKAGHNEVKFSGGEVGYYDRTERDGYFSISHDNIEVNCRYGSVSVGFTSWPVYELFHMRNWLDKVESIVGEEVKEEVKLPEGINANPTYEDVSFYINSIIKYLKVKEK